MYSNCFNGYKEEKETMVFFYFLLSTMKVVIMKMEIQWEYSFKMKRVFLVFFFIRVILYRNRKTMSKKSIVKSFAPLRKVWFEYVDKSAINSVYHASLEKVQQQNSWIILQTIRIKLNWLNQF